MAIWVVSLSTMKLSPHSLTTLHILRNLKFDWSSDFRRNDHPELYLRKTNQSAIPKYISGRTSYFRVRLAFYLYPQIIP